MNMIKEKKKDSPLELIARNVADIKSSMITKEYFEEKLEEKFDEKLEPLATKVDLMDYAKRTDLEKLATKDDITRLEAKIDAQFIKEITPLKERVTKLEKQAHPAHA